MSIVAVCTGTYHLSKRQTEELVHHFFGAKVSLGSISNIEQSVSEKLAGPYAEALACVRRARAVNIDETSWVENKKTAWLWGAACRKATVFMIRSRRSARVAKELVGHHFGGVLGSDQYGGYHWISNRRRQLCWAHLIRHFRGLLDYSDVAKGFGTRLLDFSQRMFATWHGAPTRLAFRALAPPLQGELGQILRQGAESSHRRVRSLCKGLLRREAALWTFVRDDATEPTNNAAERALRPGVLWRKTSFGTDSPRGSRFVERMLSVVATLRFQGRNILAYISLVCARKPSPLLLRAT